MSLSETPDQATALELYKQRYETFRHLDRLRWRMLQIAVTVGPLALGLRSSSEFANTGWLLASIGALLFSCGIVMSRMNNAVRLNSQQLKRFGSLVGDTELPDAGKRRTSAAFWIASALSLTGTVILLYWALITILAFFCRP